MASIPKTLRILGASDESPSARALEIETVDGSPLAPISGKYLIVNTGLTLGDKAVKRAYSLTPPRSEPASLSRATLIVKRIGPGSTALHDAAVGAEFQFSGPWGKLLPEAAPDAGTSAKPKTLVLATDTGITTAIGIAAHAQTLATCDVVEILWLRGEGETFLDTPWVEARMQAGKVPFVCATIPPVTSPERASDALKIVQDRAAAHGVELVVASGDGAALHPLRTRLLEDGVAPTVREVRVEYFFHNPERKSV